MNLPTYLVVGVLIPFLILFFILRSVWLKKTKVEEAIQTCVKEIHLKDEIIKKYTIKLGRYNGPSATLYIGKEALYFVNLATGTLEEMLYREILDVSSGSPESFYMMNANVQGILANAMTQAEIGQCVFIEVDLSYKIMTCTIAGLTPEVSSEIADQILKQKYLSDLNDY